MYLSIWCRKWVVDAGKSEVLFAWVDFLLCLEVGAVEAKEHLHLVGGEQRKVNRC